MQPRGKFLAELLQELENKLQRSLIIVETGSLRRLEPEFVVGDGYSTYFIADFINKSPFNHQFYSIDYDPSVADKFLREKNLRGDGNIVLVRGDSRTQLPCIKGPFDFIYLDSKNDADLIMEEFLTIKDKINKGGILAFDDIDQNKGKKIIPYLENLNYKINYHQNKIGFVENWEIK